MYAKRYAIYEARGKKCRPRNRDFFHRFVVGANDSEEEEGGGGEIDGSLPRFRRMRRGDRRGDVEEMGVGRRYRTVRRSIERVWQVTDVSASRKEVKKAC